MPFRPTPTPPLDRLARALAIVTDPGSVDAHPGLLAAAWADLKAARGQTVALDRLHPAYLRDAPAPADLLPPARVAAIAAAVERHRAAQRGAGA